MRQLKIPLIKNLLDPKFFDLVIDTTNTKVEKIVGEISEKFNLNT